MIKKVVLYTACFFAFTAAGAKDTNDSIPTEAHLFYEKINFINNIYHQSSNPILLSYNRIRSITDADVNIKFRRGSFHDIAQGAKTNDFGITIFGLQRFEKIDISGSINYQNTKDFERRWNSTLFLTESNPFVLGDGIYGDMLTEQFSMWATASCHLTNRFTGALKLEYQTGSLSDQTDPRPKTNAIRFKIIPGMEWRLNRIHTVGLSGRIDLFRSDLSYTNVNTNNNYTYYLMKGMGDYFIRTSNDAPSYIRDYNGEKWGGSVQWVISAPSKPLTNLLEISFDRNQEEAIDGGSSYTFKGGDYQRTDIYLYNRLKWRYNSALTHNISVTVSHYTDQGDWYDQKKQVDTEHGNKTYYEILNKAIVRKGNCSEAQITYQADFMRKNIPDIYLKTAIGFKRKEISQYEENVFKQNYNQASVILEGGKLWKIKRHRLHTVLGGNYTANIGKKAFSFISNDIAEIYTSPAFEYETASHIGVNAALSVYTPVRLYGNVTWIGWYAKINSSFYTDNARYSSIYQSTSCITLHTGLTVKF